MTKGIADLSLDLDNKWAYLEAHGDESWQTYPTYLPTVIPIMLDIFDALNLKLTVFVVGKDATIEENQPALREISRRGHEIANHSFHHQPWMQRYEPQQVVEEMDLAEQAIRLVCDAKPVGFRGPGFSLSSEILRELTRRGYRYDGSTFPTYIGPLARAYFFLRSNFSRDQAEVRDQMFGSVKDGFRRLRSYFWTSAEGQLLEIPVTTIPLLRAPFHTTYLLFLAQYSETLAMAYFRFAVGMCRMFRVAPSLLLHPLDFLGADDVDGLEFFPAMNLPGQQKRRFVTRVLRHYTSRFDVVPMGVRAEGEWRDVADHHHAPVETGF
jgi:hypothetical protein